MMLTVQSKPVITVCEKVHCFTLSKQWIIYYHVPVF